MRPLRIEIGGRCPTGTIAGESSACCCRDECCWNGCTWNTPPASCLRDIPGCIWKDHAQEVSITRHWVALCYEGKYLFTLKAKLDLYIMI